MSHVGVSIISSALTTLFGALPLCFATVQLLARFGQIMFLNTLSSSLLTLTACCALLCYQPQWRFPGTARGSMLGLIGVSFFLGFLFLILYLLATAGHVPLEQPNGSSLF